jgi:DTW domain-containing protein YfiP
MKPKDPILRAYEGRCHICYMRSEMCICNIIPNLTTSTFLTVIMHHRESYKTTNTARLACMALEKSQILLRGLKNEPLKLTQKQIHIPEYAPLLLTLSENAQVLNREFIASLQKPIHLIVPDGNWRQASKMGKREPELQKIPWIRLPPGPPSTYQLRKEHHPEGLSTLEAIARALAIIESPRVEGDLMTFFKVMVERTIQTRPKLKQT